MRVDREPSVAREVAKGANLTRVVTYNGEVHVVRVRGAKTQII